MGKTWREKYIETWGKAGIGDLVDISIHTGIPLEILNEIYMRGKGAWKTSISSVRIKGSFKKDPNLQKYPRSKRLSPEQWGMGRVYGFIGGNPKQIAKGQPDSDMWELLRQIY